MQKDGELITIDINEELETLVNKYVAKSEYNNNIKYKSLPNQAIELFPFTQVLIRPFLTQCCSPCCKFHDDRVGVRIPKIGFSFTHRKKLCHQKYYTTL